MLLTLLACAPDADTTKPEDTAEPADTLDADTIDAIEAAARSVFRQTDATGISVAVWRDGAIVYAAGLGEKNEAGDPVTADTLFQIGSDTKKMTTIGLLQHVDQGEINLDDSVAELLPELDLVRDPGHLDTFTLRELLSHQSGLFDYTRWTESPDDADLAETALGRFAENEYAMMPAGIAHNYSNPNYSLAGLIQETLAGTAWPDALEQDVARPLGMEHTWARRDSMLANEADVASGYGLSFPDGYDSFDLLADSPEYTVGWVTPEAQFDDAFTRPAGLVWSTASDMARLQIFLAYGDTAVLSEELRAEIQTGQTPLYPNLDPAAYGYGFGVFSLAGFTDNDLGWRSAHRIEHGGNTMSMTSAFVYLPDQDVGVSVLANAQGISLDEVVNAALVGAAGDRLPEAVATPDIFALPAADMSVYAGTFEDDVLGPVTLSSDGTQVGVEIPLLDELGASYDDTLTPYALDIFLLTVEGTTYDMSFYPGADGTPASHAVNRSFVLNRVPEAKARGRLRSRAQLDAWLRLTPPSRLPAR